MSFVLFFPFYRSAVGGPPPLPPPQEPGFHAGDEPFAPGVDTRPFPYPVIVCNFF